MQAPEPSRIVPARAGVAVYERGAGEPVLLVGGFPDHAIGLLPLAESLAAAGFRAVVAAYPGYAPSETLPDDDYSIPAVAADLMTVMDTLGASRFSIVGHGWGALYGYLMASLHPDRIERLVEHRGAAPGRLQPPPPPVRRAEDRSSTPTCWPTRRTPRSWRWIVPG